MIEQSPVEWMLHLNGCKKHRSTGKIVNVELYNKLGNLFLEVINIEEPKGTEINILIPKLVRIGWLVKPEVTSIPNEVVKSSMHIAAGHSLLFHYMNILDSKMATVRIIVDKIVKLSEETRKLIQVLENSPESPAVEICKAELQFCENGLLLMKTHAEEVLMTLMKKVADEIGTELIFDDL